MVREMTEKQRKVYDFIIAYKKKWDGSSPTIREIATEMGISTHSAHQHVILIEKKGVLKRNPGRGFTIL